MRARRIHPSSKSALSATHAEMCAVIAGLEACVAARRPASTPPSHSGRLLGSLLVTRGYIVESELRFVLARQAAAGGRLGELVVELGLVQERAVVELLAEQFRIGVFDATRTSLEPAIACRLPEADARRLEAVPFREQAASIAVAVSDPTRPDLVTDLTQLLHSPVHLCLTTRMGIARLIDEAHHRDASDATGSAQSTREFLASPGSPSG